MRKDKTKTQRKKIITIVLCVLWALVSFAYCLYNKSESPKQRGVYWNESTVDYSINQIQIECFDTIRFKPNTTTQSVNIHNFANNSCNMIFQIYVNDEILWESDLTNPNYGYKEIEIKNELLTGEYQGKFVVRCFDLNTNEELNGINTKITVIVE